MKHLVLLFLLSVVLFADEKKLGYDYEISLLLGDSENGFEQNIGRSVAYQVQFQYKDVDFPIKPEVAFVYSQDIPLYVDIQESRTRYGMMTVNGVYDLPYTNLLSPFVKAGGGYVNFSNVANSPDSTPFMDAGAGLKLYITDQWAVKFEALALFGADYFNVLATGGINFAFGQKYAAPPPEKTCEPCEEPKVVNEAQTPVPSATPVDSQTPVVIATPVISQKDVKMFTLENIHFDFGKAQLTDTASQESITTYAQELNKPANINKKLIIVGNTDNLGTRSYNATLSLKRANAVRREFIINQIDPNRITIDGMGEIDPIADNATEEGRKKNRRVTVILKENNGRND